MSDQSTPPPTQGLKAPPFARNAPQISLRLFATLMLFWLLLNGSISPATLITGVIVAAIIALFFGSSLSFLSGLRLTPAAFLASVGFIGFFLKELIKANLILAKLVLTPALPISPAIVKVRTTLTDPVGRLLLANAITLTPGTLTCDIQGEWLYIHWVVAPTTDPDTATKAIVSGFENYLEVMYG
ncbi:Na+/H+ antiporter subunit E [Celeribacter baekdonensis]|uniref:Na+/H+ antiporter subunit E n=1 Tax=Celeribacter baekdonensis TaxID=875171 RepID=A0A2R4M2L8_9RHOB|nr:Na+/H+ antiporter subunit E [Celeribacter baekdonensis]AVW91450.1 hypothetical protein DA792_10430 [Celeribacter baekdonensis]